MGFFDSLGKGWEFLKAAFRMAGENKRLLAPSLYAVLIQIVYWVAWVMALVAASPHWSNGVWALVSFLAILGSFTVFYFFCGVTVNMIDVHLRGGRPSVAEGMKDSGKNFVAIFFLSIISTIVDMFVSAVRDEQSIVGRLIAGIVESIWTTLTCLLLPCIIIEDAGFGQAMKRVRALHKGNLMLIGVGEVGVRGITNLIGLAWFTLIFVLEFYVIAKVFTGWTAVSIGITVFIEVACGGHTEQLPDFLLAHSRGVGFADFREAAFDDCFTDVGRVLGHGATAVSSSAWSPPASRYCCARRAIVSGVWVRFCRRACSWRTVSACASSCSSVSSVRFIFISFTGGWRAKWQDRQAY